MLQQSLNFLLFHIKGIRNVLKYWPLVSSFSCREKKDTEVQYLESSKDVESESIAELEQRNEELREKVAGLKSHYAKFLEFAKKNNIDLKPRNVPLSGVQTSSNS